MTSNFFIFHVFTKIKALNCIKRPKTHSRKSGRFVFCFLIKNKKKKKQKELWRCRDLYFLLTPPSLKMNCHINLKSKEGSKKGKEAGLCGSGADS